MKAYQNQTHCKRTARDQAADLSDICVSRESCTAETMTTLANCNQFVRDVSGELI
jgi:hypothetical protein